MKKIIVLSVNENPIYQFTLPLVVWSWLRIGWTPVIGFKTRKTRTEFLMLNTISAFGQNVFGFENPDIEGYRSDTIAQCSRLYAAALGIISNDDYLMTGDSDMMALSDYWKFDPKKITVWGHDLTSYQQMPICYIGMMKERWIEVMNLDSPDMTKMMKRDLDDLPDAGENGDRINRWCSDQRLITERINAVQFEKEFVHRGVLSNGYPIGRVDRSAWNTYHPQFIDCHLPHEIAIDDDCYAKVMRKLYEIFATEKFEWFIEYREKFKALL